MALKANLDEAPRSVSGSIATIIGMALSLFLWLYGWQVFHCLGLAEQSEQDRVSNYRCVSSLVSEITTRRMELGTISGGTGPEQEALRAMIQVRIGSTAYFVCFLVPLHSQFPTSSPSLIRYVFHPSPFTPSLTAPTAPQSTPSTSALLTLIDTTAPDIIPYNPLPSSSIKLCSHHYSPGSRLLVHPFPSHTRHDLSADHSLAEEPGRGRGGAVEGGGAAGEEGEGLVVEGGSRVVEEREVEGGSVVGGSVGSSVPGVLAGGGGLVPGVMWGLVVEGGVVVEGGGGSEGYVVEGGGDVGAQEDLGIDEGAAYTRFFAFCHLFSFFLSEVSCFLSLLFFSFLFFCQSFLVLCHSLYIASAREGGIAPASDEVHLSVVLATNLLPLEAGEPRDLLIGSCSSGPMCYSSLNLPASWLK